MAEESHKERVPRSELERDENKNNLSIQRGMDPQALIGWEVNNKYKITKYVGGGGFSEVYEAYNLNLPEQHVVIKFLKRIDSQERFEREARFLCKLDHPNICRIIDYFRKESALVMPIISGKDCGRHLDETGLLDAQTVLTVARGVSSALAYIHSMNLAHRDIKPSNIMIDQYNQVFLMDFGIAKEMGALALTGTGRAPYTPEFAAPERHAHGKEYDPYRSDIYELGATICKLATGKTPNQIGGDWKKYRLSRPMERILRKSTQPDPEERYESAAALEREFRSLKKVFRASRIVVGGLISVAILSISIAVGYFSSDLSKLIPSSTPLGDGSLKSENRGAEKSVDSLSNPLISEFVSAFQYQEATVKSEGSALLNPEPILAPAKRDSALKSSALLPTLRVSVVPEENTIIKVDGIQHALNEGFPVGIGRHEIHIESSDYPIFKEVIEIKSDFFYRKNLSELNFRKVNLVVGQSPKLPNANIRISLNNFTRIFNYTAEGILEIKIPASLWHVKFEAYSDNGQQLGIDSILVFPFTSNIRDTISVNGQEVDFGKSIWLDKENILVTLFWDL